MKQENVQKDFVEKLASIRNLLAIRFPKLDVQNLVKVMGRLAHYHYNKRECFVIGEEKELYNFLIEKGYNPFTVYRWLLLERLPEEMRFQLRQRQISQKKATTEAFDRRHETASSLGESVKDMGLCLVRRM